MGKGICAEDYVGNRTAQEAFRLMMGGSSEGELPIDIRRRLDAQESRRRKKKDALRHKNLSPLTGGYNQSIIFLSFICINLKS